MRDDKVYERSDQLEGNSSIKRAGSLTRGEFNSLVLHLEGLGRYCFGLNELIHLNQLL
ncbi:protein of unknown function [Legionella fallonii LLAP-10]|uniref:Uncharacterized protein n=1 Tax=Legionella fallonii LLAP-10 TaxID=1212491 RepID=A0A098G7X8_9GAMM|nr:protein of unknown function [Legionella fallonii LLAP-10]